MGSGCTGSAEMGLPSDLEVADSVAAGLMPVVPGAMGAGPEGAKGARESGGGMVDLGVLDEPVAAVGETGVVGGTVVVGAALSNRVGSRA